MSAMSQPIRKKIPDFIRHDKVIGHGVKPKKAPYQPLIGIYLLRLALALKDQLPSSAFANLFDQNELGVLTGLANHKDFFDITYNINNAGVFDLLNTQLSQLLNQDMQINAPLFSNIKTLALEFQLSDVEQELLALSLLMAGVPKFSTFLEEYCSPTENTSVVEYLHFMTLRPIKALKRCLNHSTLYSAGWVETLEYFDPSRLLVPPMLLFQLFRKRYTQKQLRKIFFTEEQKSTLTAEAFPTAKADLDILIPALRSALEQKLNGINILIYGASSIGKRELARLISTSMDIPLIKICIETLSKTSLEPQDRFAACQTTQLWLNAHQTQALLLFDEADSIFPFDVEDDEGNKGIKSDLLTSQLLNNSVPVIWIISDPRKIGNEWLQEFDYAIEVSKIPTDLRNQRIVKATQELGVSAAWQEQLSKRTDIPLYQIKKAANFAKLGKENDGSENEQIVERVLNSHCQLFKRQNALERFKPVTHYDLSFSNTSIALADIAQGLKRHPLGTLCLYGAPGTGKTAFARHLADHLGMPILVKRASDILNKYIGESEKNLAKMFREAKRDGAILLLDEADTFLADRNNARYNWEISGVNELLTQMESFEGIFICTTNLMERMDAASLRRFDFKIKFDYLTPDQRWALFQQESQRLGARLPLDSQLHDVAHQIHALTKLTPGDFAVLSRQAKFRENPHSIDEMIQILQQECLAKGEHFGKIGFVH